jgi:hypothetical protein
MEKGLSLHFKKETSIFLLATLTATPTIDRKHQRTAQQAQRAQERTTVNGTTTRFLLRGMSV